jgi:hypothetical protein
LTVESLNGVRNRSINVGAVREADPEFKRTLQLLREVQASGAFGMRVEETRAKGSAAVLFFRHEDAPADILEKLYDITCSTSPWAPSLYDQTQIRDSHF